MAAVLDADRHGPSGSIECDAAGCKRHVSARPFDRTDWAPQPLLDTLMEWATDEGWLLNGLTWCPAHRGPHEGSPDMARMIPEALRAS